MNALPDIAVAEHLAACIAALAVPVAVRERCIDLAVDVIGLCVTARNEDYVRATLAGCDDDGPCTAIGHVRTMSAAGAAPCPRGTAEHLATDTRGHGAHRAMFQAAAPRHARLCPPYDPRSEHDGR